jgi:hypothetical protein
MVFFGDIHVFLQLSQIGLLGAISAYLHFATPNLRKYSFKNELNSHRETMCYMLLLLKLMVCFREIHVFLPFSQTGIFGVNRAYLHLVIPKLQEVFLSKTNSFVQGKQCARCSLLLNRCFSFENTCVSSPLLNRRIWKK